MLAFHCPKCDAQLAIPPEKGKLSMVRCPQCKQRISLPRKKKNVSVHM